jgi:predicted DNA-binding transcriptional regulator YafY
MAKSVSRFGWKKGRPAAGSGGAGAQAPNREESKFFKRFERLMWVARKLITSYPRGEKVSELANNCLVSTKQIRRDIETIESFGARISTGNARYSIEPGSFIPFLKLTSAEAVTIFLAARLRALNSNAHNPVIVDTFDKLGAVLPAGINPQVKKSFEWLQKQPPNKPYVEMMRLLSEAWSSGYCVEMSYQPLGQPEASDRIVEPYFIQPAPLEHANYLIGYCRYKKRVTTFKIERIKRLKPLYNAKYEIPASFDINEYLGTAWGVAAYGDISRVKLLFKEELARVALETRWHPSQVNVLKPDGNVVTAFRVSVNLPFIGFILQWGNKVEVLEPAALRKKVADEASKIVKIY